MFGKLTKTERNKSLGTVLVRNFTFCFCSSAVLGKSVDFLLTTAGD